MIRLLNKNRSVVNKIWLTLDFYMEDSVRPSVLDSCVRSLGIVRNRNFNLSMIDSFNSLTRIKNPMVLITAGL